MQDNNRFETVLTWRVWVRTMRLVLLDFVGCTKGGKDARNMPNRREQILGVPVMA